MAMLLSVLGWVLVVGAAVLVAASPWLPSAAFEPLRTALPAGVLIALAGHLFTQGRNARDSAEKQSHFYLESCIQAYEEARTLLIDSNNSRPTWIAAGRALVHAKELASKVTIDSHLRVLELNQLKYRGFFSELLESNPAAFFYGASNSSIDIDDAARESTSRQERGGRTITSTLRSIPEKALYAVWEAAQWPQDYQDPLESSFSTSQRELLSVRYPGLHAYLEHCQQWHSASGQLFPREHDRAR